MKPATRAVATALRPATARSRVLRAGHGGRALTIIGWHRVDGETSVDLSTGVPDFVAHLDAIAAWGAVVMPLDEAVVRLYAGTLPPRATVLTFDDGYASVVETASIPSTCWKLCEAAHCTTGRSVDMACATSSSAARSSARFWSRRAEWR